LFYDIEQHNWPNIFDYTQITNRIPGFNLDFKVINNAIWRYKNGRINDFMVWFDIMDNDKALLLTDKFFSDVYNKKAIGKDLNIS